MKEVAIIFKYRAGKENCNKLARVEPEQEETRERHEPLEEPLLTDPCEEQAIGAPVCPRRTRTRTIAPPDRLMFCDVIEASC